MSEVQAEGLYPYTTNAGKSFAEDREEFDVRGGVFSVVTCGDQVIYIPVWTQAGEGGEEQNCAGYIFRRIFSEAGVEWLFPGKVWINDLWAVENLIRSSHDIVNLEGTNPRLTLSGGVHLYTYEQLSDFGNQLMIGDRLVMYLVTHLEPSKLVFVAHFAEFIGHDEEGNAILLNDDAELIEGPIDLKDMYRTHGGLTQSMGDPYPTVMAAVYRPKPDMRLALEVEALPPIGVRERPVG
ncbi:MAG: hypothetical protein JNK26_04020 [Candidatus Doudnabacteria bacterium]|nr:hypothetical protein [Candidatus Doudnabacteria bacterium]